MRRTVLAALHFLRDSLTRWSYSASEREYAETLRRRPRLFELEFYDTFYAGTGIPRAIPARLRKLLESIIGDDLAAIHPEDNIAAIYDGLDFADVLSRVEREFDLRIPLTVVFFQPRSEGPRICPANRIDGTFDSLVRYLTARMAEG